MPIEDLIRRVTINPAKALGREDLGRPERGGIGDAAVLRIEEGELALQDVDGREHRADQWIVAVGVVRAGEYIDIRM